MASNIEELTERAAALQAADAQFDHSIRVCTASGCLSLQSDQLKTEFEAELKRRGLEKTCQVKGVGCFGPCAQGPVVAIEPDGVVYQEIKPSDIPAIVDALDTAPVEELILPADAPFFARQVKIVLENSGNIDPENIEDYIAAGGYEGLVRALHEMTPLEVIDRITKAGLRGRGGAGYPTGLKWSTVAKSEGAHKYVICNGDEGDPGAFMDRSVMEADPHRVIEGMLIAGYAVGADFGYLYVRAEYPLAVKTLKTAIRQATKQGFLGKNICGTPFNFEIDVRLGAGAFVCGEETALIASIEGKRGQPRPRPPYPAESGLWGYPTLINNVESFANIAPILRKGHEWFHDIGFHKNRGTKVFALSGKINNIGLIEVPMGISLRDVIFEIGGGIPDGKAFKAVQTGGPSGGCIPAEHLDTPISYESLSQLGSMMGSGGMIVMDETSCMVDVAKYFTEFCMEESCGKCVPCRVGTAHMYDLVCKICDGTATLDDLALLEQLCDVVKNTSLCGLGAAAPNAVVSTLRYFRDEYIAHIVEKRCPAGKCKMKVEA